MSYPYPIPEFSRSSCTRITLFTLHTLNLILIHTPVVPICSLDKVTFIQIVHKIVAILLVSIKAKALVNTSAVSPVMRSHTTATINMTVPLKESPYETINSKYRHCCSESE